MISTQPREGEFGFLRQITRDRVPTRIRTRLGGGMGFSVRICEDVDARLTLFIPFFVIWLAEQNVILKFQM